MNIFLTSVCPIACAVALDDRRVIKMCLETAQLLSSAATLSGVLGAHLYKTTHRNHPCAIWARNSRGNFDWLVAHGLALSDEYSHRYGNGQHASRKVIEAASGHRMALPSRGTGYIFNCSGYDSGDLYNDYRLCMIDKWDNIDPVKSKPPVWTRRDKPEWYNEERS